VTKYEFVPEPSPDLVITLAGLEAQREERGNAWCEKHGVGARRRVVERELPDDARSETPHPYCQAKAHARVLLAAYCRHCGGCPWARK
jgi:hypothetical protein